MAKNWITTADLGTPYSTDPYAQQAVDAASWTLFKLTAQKYPGQLDIVDEEYVLSNHGNCGFDEYAGRLYLKHNPVNSINSFSINGEFIDVVQVRVGNRSFIDLKFLGITSGTITVSYTYGMNPPQAGKKAAITLAQEFLNEVNGGRNCKLPARVSQVSSQGVSMTLLDPQDFLDKGRTGISSIDLFIKTANPAGARAKPKIYSSTLVQGVTYR